jgi:hypothetical protein
MKRIELKGIEQIVFDGFQSRPLFGYKWPPPGGKDSMTNAIVQQAITALGTLDAATYAARRDAGLSPSGRVAKVQAQREAANKVVVDAFAKLAGVKQRTMNARTKLFALPQLSETDAAGALLDAEIRQRIGSLGEAARAALNKGISNGDRSQDRILHALARDPFPTPDSMWAKAVHADRVAADNPDTVASLETDEESFEWGQSAVAGLQSVLKNTETSGIAAVSQETV